VRIRLAVVAIVLASCGAGSLQRNLAASDLPAATPTAGPTATPPQLAPIVAGATADAGVLLVRGEDDIIYRYDGAAGDLRAVSRHATLTRTTAGGAYFEGLEGGIVFVAWTGEAERVTCGPGRWGRLSSTGACASFLIAADRSLWVSDGSTSTPRLLLPADWGLIDAQWTPDARSLVLLRSQPGPTFETRAHNALWLLAPDGSLRKLYEPLSREASLSGLRISPDGRSALVSELPIISASLAADGSDLVFVDLISGRVSGLGRTLLAHSWTRWSDDGRLAFVRGGGRETWSGKQLVVRERDGSVTVVAGDSSTVALAPAWRGSDLYWVQGSAGENLDRSYVRGVGDGVRYGVRLSGGVRTNLPFDGIVEGIRPSADGRSALILARRPTDQPPDQYRQLELWLVQYHLDGSARATRLITNLGGLAFGYYGLQPSLFDLVAWSLDPH
jgi:hypothetical protein